MKRIFPAVLTLLFLCTAGIAGDWSRFRGPNGSGVVGDDIPTRWSSTANLKWAADLPGSGTSSPIVVGNRVYLTAYTGYGVDAKNPGKAEDLVRHLLAFDRNTGKELWRTSVPSAVEEDPYKGFITQHGYASATPTSDGERIFALFGKTGLFAFDLDGKQLWKTSLGTKSDPARWGGGASPMVHGDHVIVNAGILGNQFIAVDRRTGKTAWKIEDPSFTNCWSTPTIATTDSGPQLLFHVPKQVIAVEPATGKKLWTLESPLNDATCGCIVTQDGLAYLMGSRMGRAMALRAGSEGTKLWSKRMQSSISTPLLLGGNLYWLTGGSVFTAVNTEDGSSAYRERLPIKGAATSFPNSDYSSPVAARDKILLFRRNGESYVIRAGDEFELLGHNPPFDGDDSAFSSTPAVSEGDIFIRSERKLYCIGRRSI